MNTSAITGMIIAMARRMKPITQAFHETRADRLEK